ncbi:MAG: endopeptidase La [Armatimonadetes bacterium]|nr:endopeptidase La [Armatimonadota bacterium]
MPRKKDDLDALWAPVLPLRDTIHFPGVIQTLLVGREMSVNALHLAMGSNREALVVGQIDPSVEEPRADDMYRVGTLSEILHVLPLPDGTMRVVLRGLHRCKVEKYRSVSGCYHAEYKLLVDVPHKKNALEAHRREVISLFHQATNLGLQVPPEVMETLGGVEVPSALADLISHHLPGPTASKQAMLELLDPEKRLTELAITLSRELQVLELQAALRTKVEKELGQTQREYYLREQIKAIQQELGGDDVLSEEGEEYRRKLEATGMNEENLARAMQELKRLERAPGSSPEGMVIRNYLDWLIALPWSTLTDDKIDVSHAATILDRDHYGLEKVKDRILDFLAVRQVSHSLRGPILCFVGPPGVGKTSIGRSIAESLGRSFHRISLGGVRDEAEIRGHRRTYIGSMPGRLIQGLKQCGSRNPVFMLDEIDKMTSDLRGDPTSALLEALDPAQNSNFSDHYIEMPVDLSAVMFIATANLLENIPPALRDRMEIIRFPSYTEQEKLEIAKTYLLPKQLGEHGLKPTQLKVGKPAFEMMVREYTREAGVRSLEREIATLCRKTARHIAEGSSKGEKVDAGNLSTYLGRPKFRYGSMGKQDEVGVATGMVYSEYGGDIVTIEAFVTEPFGEQPQIRLTGSLGDVMKESAYAAMSYVRANQKDLADREFRFDVHVHVPEGAVPKDGPSAGVTLVTALASAFSQRPIRSDLAMTGEVTLRGKVLPVGGIREKVLAAHRAGIRTIILPQENEHDLDDLPANVREDLSITFVSEVREVLALALR